MKGLDLNLTKKIKDGEDLSSKDDDKTNTDKNESDDLSNLEEYTDSSNQ